VACSGIKEIAPEYDLQSWVRPLVSRDKFERIFRELSAQWKLEKVSARVFYFSVNVNTADSSPPACALRTIPG